MRGFIFILAFAGAAGGVPFASVAADAVPTFNIVANCKAEIAGGSSIGETLESCINDEQQARDQLAEQWAQVSKADRAACIREASIDGTPSYVELQTCVELHASARPRSGDGK